MKKYPDIYRKTVTEARNGGNTELDKYRTSLKENIACAKAIEIQKYIDNCETR